MDVFTAFRETAETVPSDNNNTSEKGGCFDEGVGRRYRDAILRPGATKPGMDMLRAFLGREPTIDAWVAAGAEAAAAGKQQ